MAIKNYGLPYMGSKNKIADWVLSYLPNAENLYDLFCGGSAITHCAMERGKYSNYYVNDIEPIMPQAFVDAVNGKFKNEDRWISREDFFRLKDTDPYVRLCFSFGSNGKGYLYGKDKEPIKKALHFAIVFGDYSLVERYGIDCSCMDGIVDRVDRRLVMRSYLNANMEDQSPVIQDKLGVSIKQRVILENESRFSRLNGECRVESIERTERLQSLEATNLSYDDVNVKPNSVIYCDIPYRSTATYNEQPFDYDKFYDWCESQQQQVFISEYWMPEDRFICIAEKNKIVSLSATNNSKKAIEKIFIPKHQESQYNKRTLF